MWTRAFPTPYHFIVQSRISEGECNSPRKKSRETALIRSRTSSRQYEPTCAGQYISRSVLIVDLRQRHARRARSCGLDVVHMRGTGTTLPSADTSVMAALRREAEFERSSPDRCC
jgi:hypothetical protein